MKIELSGPAMGEEISLLFPAHQDFIKAGGGGGPASGVDWSHLVAQGQDYSRPRPAKFCWRADSGDADFELLLSEQPSCRVARIVRTLPGALCASVSNLKIGTAYYWRVRARKEGRIIARSPVWRFVTADGAPRWLSVPDITNVRDVGGWKTAAGHRIRQGMIFRGSEMERHAFITEEGKDVMSRQLGIRTDLDLRGEVVGEQKDTVLADRGVRWWLLPVPAYADFFSEENKDKTRTILKGLCQEAVYPVYIHCWGGADRTGTLVLLLQALLGVGDAELLLDYELTSFSIWGARSRELDLFRDMLKALEAYGEKDDPLSVKIENYVLSTGVTAEEITKLRSLLLEQE